MGAQPNPARRQMWHESNRLRRDELLLKLRVVATASGTLPLAAPLLVPFDGLSLALSTVVEAATVYGVESVVHLLPVLRSGLDERLQGEQLAPSSERSAMAALATVSFLRQVGLVSAEAYSADVARWSRWLVEQERGSDGLARLELALICTALGQEAVAEGLVARLGEQPVEYPEFYSLLGRVLDACQRALRGEVELPALLVRWEELLCALPDYVYVSVDAWAVVHAVGGVVFAQVGEMPLGQVSAQVVREVQLAYRS